MPSSPPWNTSLNLPCLLATTSPAIVVSQGVRTRWSARTNASPTAEGPFHSLGYFIAQAEACPELGDDHWRGRPR